MIGVQQNLIQERLAAAFLKRPIPNGIKRQNSRFDLLDKQAVENAVFS